MHSLGSYQFSVLCLFMFFYFKVVVSEKSGHYIGCFKEWSGKGAEANKGKFFPDFHQGFDYMTPKLCIAMCKRLNIKYSGLQNGKDCYCSRKTPDRSRLAEESSCGIPCAGDADQKCGGSLRLNVYDSGFEAKFVEPVPTNTYVGCFKENSEEDIRRLGRYFSEFNQVFDDLHPKVCFDVCFKSGYKYAGLQAGKECYCTNKELDVNRKTADTECKTPCPGDDEQKCGGILRMSVYKTKLGEEESRRGGSYLGCLKESTGGRVLKGQGSWVFSDKLTPQLCIEECHRHNFKISGSQYGLDCRCSNEKLDMTLMTVDEDCDMWCFGDRNQMCGGFLRISVYSTGYPGPVATANNGLTLQPKQPQNPKTEENQPKTPEQPATPGPQNCALSKTIVNRKRVCKNSVIFYDNFRKFDSDKWVHDIKIAVKPDYEFTVYDKKPENSFVKDGKLHLKPTIFEDDFVENGEINLDGCTGDVFDGECSRKTDFMILPPIQSARITTRQKFNFKYGYIEVQAKFPVGDWITADIRLVPTDNTYGSYYESGVIRIMSRGNQNLKNPDGKAIGCQTIEGAVMLGYGNNVQSKSFSYVQKECWRDRFHNFTIHWTPDDITFIVDGRRRQNLMANSYGARLSDVIGLRSSDIRLWSSGTTIAPFDQPFHLSLGVSVGGVRDFRDGSDNNGESKPWSNTSPKAVLSFWEKKNEWQPTWKGDSVFQIKSVKITAL